MSSKTFASAAVLAVMASTSAFAHGDHWGLSGTVLEPGITLVAFEYDFVNYNPISDARLTELAGQGVEEVHSLSSIAVPSLSLAYGLTKNLTFGMRIPYLDNKEIRETNVGPPPGVNARGGVDGFGDISFAGTYRVIHDEVSGFEGTVTIGVKAPTGDKNVYDINGELFETEHQPSSGSWDGIFGAAISRPFGALTLSANANYGLAGNGSQDTTLGDRFNYGINASYRLWTASGGFDHAMHLGGKFDGMMHHGGADHADEAEHSHAKSHGTALDVSLGLNGQWWGEQDVAGERDGNTGGNVLFVTPGVRLTMDQWAGFVSVGVPVSVELNGYQSEPDWQLSTGISMQF